MGLALVALGAYAHSNLAEFPYIKQIGDLVVICGLGLFFYAVVMMAMEQRTYRR